MLFKNGKKKFNTLVKNVLLLAAAFALFFTSIIPAHAEAPYGVGPQIDTLEDDGGEYEVSPEDAEDYRKWAQADPRWGSIRLGAHGRTVAEAGCLVTAMTKLIIQSGYRSPDSFNVATLVNWLNANGGLSDEGNLYWYKPAEMIDGFEFEGMDWNGGYSSSSSMQAKIMEHVRANKHVVLTVKNYGHYVAVDNAKSLAMGEVYIMDSLNNVSGNADITLASRYSYVSRLSIYSGNNAEDSDYISRCSFAMTHLLARVVSSYAFYYTLPCTLNAGEGSETAGRAYAGSLIEVTADIVNTLGERWHQVRISNDECVYIWAGQLEFVEFVNDLQIESDAPPSGTLPVGRWYNLTENVVSRHNIVSVTGRISDIDANIVSIGVIEPDVHGGVDISGTAVDAGLTFGSLPEGHYSYELFAEVYASSSLTSETATFRRIFTSPFSTGLAPLPVYTVTYDDPVGNILIETEAIAQNFYAVQPVAPRHEGYEFMGWSHEDRISGDTRIVALYSSPNTLGDVNSDGSLSMTDALMVLRYAMNIHQGGRFNEQSADFNGDGNVNTTDALLIMRAVLSMH